MKITIFLLRHNYKKIIYLCGFLFLTFSAQAETIYELDFSTASGDVKNWFEAVKWEFREKAVEMLRFEDGKLVIEPTRDELGVVMREFDKKDYLHGVTKLRIEWGVDQYPIGADWSGPKDKFRNTREPIAFMVFLVRLSWIADFFLHQTCLILSVFFSGKMRDLIKSISVITGKKGDVIFAFPVTAAAEKHLLQKLTFLINFLNYLVRNNCRLRL